LVRIDEKRRRFLRENAAKLSQVAAENERRARKLEAQYEHQQVDNTMQEGTIAPPPVKSSTFIRI